MITGRHLLERRQDPEGDQRALLAVRPLCAAAFPVLPSAANLPPLAASSVPPKGETEEASCNAASAENGASGGSGASRAALLIFRLEEPLRVRAAALDPDLAARLEGIYRVEFWLAGHERDQLQQPRLA
jgi:hypothetical protein